MSFISTIISKIFGDKHKKDIESLEPIKVKILEYWEQFQLLSNDDLRAKTLDFQTRIKNYIKEEDEGIAGILTEIETDATMSVDKKEELYDSIEEIKKIRTKKIEEILNDLLPEAFAVMKETANRFANNETVEVTATDMDIALSERTDFVKLNGDKAIYATSWNAAGSLIKWNMVHYDVQLVGGIVMHQGKLAEMATGEGKTLVATSPVYLNALAGEGVHMVTVNDYLARRDSEWMGPLYQFHGLTVDCIDKHQPNSPERRNAYACDVTFGTNNEFGFDYLRDNMVRTPEEMVQRIHNYAIIDEVDSVLVDDARTPLIISGPTPKGDVEAFMALKPPVERLVGEQRKLIDGLLAESKEHFKNNQMKEAGIAVLKCHRGFPKFKALIKYLSEPGVKSLMQKTENEYLQDNGKEMKKIDKHLFFIIEENQNTVSLTDKGIDLISDYNSDDHFFVIPDILSLLSSLDKEQLNSEEKTEKKEQIIRDYSIKSERVHTVSQLLKAYTMFEIENEYVIMDGKIKIVDEQTGRIMEGRRYSDGLHQALEAKENVEVEALTQTYATVTLQNFFRMYNKLSGMTGTAITEATEFYTIYKLDVVSIPTNRSIARNDMHDLVYKTNREKYQAVAEEIKKLVAVGRPVLVGTTTVEISELLSNKLNEAGIKHNVLNAKLHQKEAEIVAEAGFAGNVTIATNMAGRGTDIKLGKGVKEAGGLAILGTERHESRRVDRQLRGRAGRQGDPGSSQFFVSLEDNLMRLFGSERIASLMDKMGLKEGEVIESPMVSKSIERAQKKVEENNFGVRKRLIEYDDVMNSQREVIYKRRRNALYGGRLAVDIADMFFDVASSIAEQFAGSNNYEDFEFEIFKIFACPVKITAEELKTLNTDKLSDRLFRDVYTYYRQEAQQLNKKVIDPIRNIYENEVVKNGKTIDNVMLPVTDGNYIYQVPIPLKKAIDTNGREIFNAIERTFTLKVIDENWKEHLREVEDLRQYTNNASYEQKDPLVVYKLEAYKLFAKMLVTLAKEVITELSRIEVYTEQQPQAAQQVSQNRGSNNSPQNQIEQNNTKISRNDPCPCGSGQKFKNCHGANI